jgi:hypothetical protein
VWTKPAAAKRECYVVCTSRGCASISKQDFSDNLIVALLVRETGLISPDSTQFLHAFCALLELKTEPIRPFWDGKTRVQTEDVPNTDAHKTITINQLQLRCTLGKKDDTVAS